VDECKPLAAGSSVMAVVAAPGFAATNLQVTTAADGGLPTSGAFGNWVFGLIGQSPEDGTMPLLTCVAAAGVQAGAYTRSQFSTT